jgi:hypothetical protein
MQDGFHQILFTKDADGSTVQANVDASGAVQRWTLKPASTDLYRVNEIVVCIADSDADYNLYGNIAALTNGILLRRETNDGAVISTVYSLLGALAVKQLTHWGRYGQVFPINDSASATRTVTVLIKFNQPIILRGDKGDQLSFILNDNLTGLDGHTFLANLEKQGLM